MALGLPSTTTSARRVIASWFSLVLKAASVALLAFGAYYGLKLFELKTLP